MESKILTACPSVYAVGDEYQICALVNSECTMWVEVEGNATLTIRTAYCVREDFSI